MSGRKLPNGLPAGAIKPPPPPSPPDPVNHPPYYNAHPSGVECIDVVEHMSFNLGNAIKYIWRGGMKAGQLEDLKKARWYVDREIARLEKASR